MFNVYLFAGPRFSSNPEPGSSGSPTSTSFLELISSSLYFQLAFCLAVIFMILFLFSYLTEERRNHRGYIHGRTPEVKIFNFFAYTNLCIRMLPSCPVHLGNPAGAPPSPQVFQPLNTGVDSSSGLPASQQPLPTPPPVSVPCSPTSQPLNNAVDSSSGLPVSEQSLPTPRPVFEARPSTCQPILNNGVNSSAGFPASQQPSSSPPPKTFTIEKLNVATEWFSDNNLLGHGGFGHVYKGILEGGEIIAVKRFNVGASRTEGEIERSFQTELQIMSRVNHRNLVSLLGYCNADSQRLLVYEFVPNNTLEHHLHAEGQPCMDLPTRLKIAAGVARGLVYLHEECYPMIIHGDIKPANILLDSSFEPMIADFGSAKLALGGSYVFGYSEAITFGYCDPECLATGIATDKADVYSFGVMLLELITGRKAIQGGSNFDLVDSTRPKLLKAMSDGILGELVDPRLQGYKVNKMLTLIGLAVDCVERFATNRCSMKRAYLLCGGENSN